MPNLLIVDDDPAIRRGLVRYFRIYEDIEIRDAFTAEEAIEQLDDFTPTHVISDLDMGPGMDGLNLLKNLRERFPTVKMVLSSGNPDPSISQRAHAIGAFFIPKPAGGRDLAQTLGISS